MKNSTEVGARSSPASINSSRVPTATESSIAVDVATEADREDLAPLILFAIESVFGSRGGSSRLRHLGESPATIRDALISATGPVMLVARSDSAICGFAALARSEPVLEMVFVDPSRRREGVGRALVAAAEVEAVRRGQAPLRAMVAAGSRSEKSLFEALGYRAELLMMEPRTKS